MRVDHHLTPATLRRYLSGTLPEPLALAAAAHVYWCPPCRHALESARTCDATAPVSQPGGPVAAARPAQTETKAKQKRSPAESGAGEFDGADTGLPGPLTALLGGVSLDDLRWRKVMPGIAVHRLPLSPGATGRACLVRFLPGKGLPEHGHAGSELTVVLRGSYRDQLDRYAIGDVADLDDAAWHRPVAESDGCICLLAAENPARYRSLSGRLWQLLLGL